MRVLVNAWITQIPVVVSTEIPAEVSTAQVVVVSTADRVHSAVSMHFICSYKMHGSMHCGWG